MVLHSNSFVSRRSPAAAAFAKHGRQISDSQLLHRPKVRIYETISPLLGFSVHQDLETMILVYDIDKFLTRVCG